MGAACTPAVVADAYKLLKIGLWLNLLRVFLIILHVEFHLPILPRAFFQDVRLRIVSPETYFHFRELAC